MEDKTENRICQNCKKDFIIESEDFNFYEKIKVPPPTFCPECRFIRRFASTNERVLYKRKCDFSGEDIFSMYEASVIFPVYKTDIWYSDSWDSYKYGMEYDFSKPFFAQFLELQKKVPRVDCFEISQCELCYECIDCDNCYKTKFSQESKECRDCFFMYGCRNCSDCVGCVNLINQQFCIFNEKYSKEEYFKKLEELKLNTAFGIEYMERKFKEFRKKFPQKSTVTLKSESVSGNWFTNSKNVKESFWCINVKDGKYLFSIFDAQDCMDYFQWGNSSELIYESENCGINCSRLSFCTQCWMGAHDLFYCDSCPGSSNCFGCIGLKKGEYSILNKKYSKEEYEIIKEKIIKQMKEIPYVDNRGIEYRFGENFPDSVSCFAYNETAAADFFPLTKEEVISKRYKWKEREKKNYKTTIESSSLPETIKEVDDSILNEVISCAEKDSQYSVGAYKITQNELSFYRRMDLPLPRVCFDVRHMRRLAKRPLPKLQKRNCSKCGLEVNTIYGESYAPIIYCEECYKQEVY